MNKTLEYINENYFEDIKGHSYINRSKFDFLKKGQYIKAVNREDLKMELNGTITSFPVDTYDFIRAYNYKTRKYIVIYPDNYYIFIKSRATKKMKEKEAIMDFFKKVENFKAEN